MIFFNLIENHKIHHIHVNDESNQHEVTIALYDNNNLLDFDVRSREVILNNK